MDEEDIREAEESRNIQTTTQFAGFGTEHDIKRQGAFVGLFRPTGASMGQALLERMGWKVGQGIGRRVKRAADLGEGADTSGKEYLFAPENVSMVSFQRKDNPAGLGYVSDPQSSATTSDRGNKLKEERDDDDVEYGTVAVIQRPKKKPGKAAFGVGVFNDTGSDDDDPYSIGPRIFYNKAIGGDKKSKRKLKAGVGNANPALDSRPTFIPKKLSSVSKLLRKCHDGRLPLDGFVLADELEDLSILDPNDEKHQPLSVPEGWKSSKMADAEEARESGFVSTADAAKASNLDSKSRASLLGEVQLPGKSVFDYLTPASREKLALASGKDNLPPALSERPPPGFESEQSQLHTSLASLVPHLDQAVATQALERAKNGWMPYSEELGKQDRYYTFLKYQAKQPDVRNIQELPPRDKGVSQDDWINELREFTRAAEVFKPVSGLIASRFTSSAAGQLHLSGEDAESGSGGSLLLRQPLKKPEDPAVSAAEMGLFGPMTRTVVNFYPTRLLCKRFNVPLPEHSDVHNSQNFPASPSATAPPFRVPVNRFSSGGLENLEAENATANHKERETTATQLTNSLEQTRVPATAASPESMSERNDVLEQDKPGRAVFRAIFGSDDEDDDT